MKPNWIRINRLMPISKAEMTIFLSIKENDFSLIYVLFWYFIISCPVFRKSIPTGLLLYLLHNKNQH